MPRTSTASAPGKLILAGEHAVVYGRPALVAAVDLRLTATLARRDGRGERTVRIEVPQLGVAEEVAWEAVREHARAARRRWEAWAAGSGESFSAVRGGDAAHVVKVALGEAADHLGEPAPPSLDLAIRSELPLGSGFGSSAAAAVTVVAGFCALLGRDPAPAEIEALAREVERRQHGLPSGVDAATVLHGGVLWAERGPDGRLAIEPFPGRSPLLADLAVFDTGTPADSTGAVVAAVRERYAVERERIDPAWEAIEGATRELRALLEEGVGGAEGRRRLVELIRALEAGLEVLGIVPEPVRELVRRVEAAGGAAKVSGAGTITGEAAGSLLVAHPEPERVAEWGFLGGLVRHPVALGGAGLRVEVGD
ncbi:MAG TPA: hypothetical protein VHM02_10635 [Thermoanaerobaculia bacterium]|nr:hypothetical protein [Thermoanaerobaculia bacterium]